MLSFLIIISDNVLFFSRNLLKSILLSEYFFGMFNWMFCFVSKKLNSPVPVLIVSPGNFWWSLISAKFQMKYLPTWQDEVNIRTENSKILIDLILPTTATSWILDYIILFNRNWMIPESFVVVSFNALGLYFAVFQHSLISVIIWRCAWGEHAYCEEAN